MYLNGIIILAINWNVITLDYYKSMLDENKFDMKNMWSVLKQVNGKCNNKTTLHLSFAINERSVTNKLKVVDGVNEYFLPK